MAGDASGDEAAWRDLIARLHTTTAEGTEPAPWPAQEDLTVPPRRTPGDPVMGPLSGSGAAPVPAAPRPDSASDPDPGAEQDPGLEHDPSTGDVGWIRARIVRPAARDQLPAEPLPGADDDDHYVPPPPPPLPSLDPVAKGAWAALFGGPGYLLLAVMAGWQIPGWAAFCAVAAFVAGFATLVIRMGDQPPRDSGPDNGAVV